MSNRSHLVVQQLIKPACHLKWTSATQRSSWRCSERDKTLHDAALPALEVQAHCEDVAAVWNQYVVAIVTLNFPSAAVCWSHSAAAAAADACTYHVLPGVTQVTSL